jgi:hypothetical protein
LLIGAENGLGDTGIGEWAEPNDVLAVGTGSGVVGDGGTFGFGSGEGHKVEDAAEEAESMYPPSLSGSFADSSYGSRTVGSGEGGGWKSGSHS